MRNIAASLNGHFGAFKLIACCSTVTKYEHSIDALVEIETGASQALIDRMLEAGRPFRAIDDELIHIVFSALFNGSTSRCATICPEKKPLPIWTPSGNSTSPDGSKSWGYKDAPPIAIPRMQTKSPGSCLSRSRGFYD